MKVLENHEKVKLLQCISNANTCLFWDTLQ